MFALQLRLVRQNLRTTTRTHLWAQSWPLGTRNRFYTTEKKDLDVTHSHFLAEASPQSKWKKHESTENLDDASHGRNDELEGVSETRGKLSPTSSHLFKLILPLGSLSHPSNTQTEPETNADGKEAHTPPTVILLHPSQPLSHVSRLILASLAPATPSISFRSVSSGGQAFQWSDSTDVGDFIRDAARAAEFTICISYGSEEAKKRILPHQEDARIISVKSSSKANQATENGITETLLAVTVPTFVDRTRFLRRRLNMVEGRLQDMEGLKNKCDELAHRGARKMAMVGFGMLVVYWGAVARLTFWDFGWDVMEPVTYLSGLSTVILGYLWFLYQGREVSYTSVLARSISARREALYKARGFDIERWIELVGEKKTLRSEIGRIARDYENDDDKKPEDLEEEGGGNKEPRVDDVPEKKSVVEKQTEEELRGDKGKNVEVNPDEQAGRVKAKKANEEGGL